MKRLILLALVLPLSMFAQASGFRAQGRYYSAKEAFEKGRYDEAAQMLRESRQYLGGKSNNRLQYLLVSSLYNAGRFKLAQDEMALFFKLEETQYPEKEQIYQSYPQDVDKLTPDETKAVSQMIDKIDREVANNTEGKRAAEKQQQQDAAERSRRRHEAYTAFSDLIVKSYTTKDTPFPGPNGWSPEVQRITLSGSYEAVQVIVTQESDHNQPRVPMARRKLVATLNLAQLAQYSHETYQPGKAKSTVGHYRVGAYMDENLSGSAHGPTTIAYLEFHKDQSQYRDNKKYGSDGRLIGSDSYSSNYRGIQLPVTSEENLHRAIDLIKAAR